ncbi:golgin subfamily A member 6-like protein 7 isoform X2 [Dysidea avara]|uniref:golgin subfamily A member 6-like protein 7 isoform X2 n=1 Tax=Dysidea avara TaxID=196820 RepID=UPI0033248A45
MNPWMWTPLYMRLTSKDFEKSEDLVVEEKKLPKDELLIKLREAKVRCIKYQEALKRLEADKQDLEKGNTLLTAELSEERNRLAEEKKALIKQLRKDGPPTAKQSSGDSTQQFVGKRGDEQLLVLSEQKQLLQQEVDMLKEEVRELKAAEGKDEPDLQHKDEATQLQAEIEQLKEKWAQTRAERDHMKKDYDQMMIEHNRLTKSHNQLQLEITQLQEQNTQVILVRDQLRREKDELHRHFSQSREPTKSQVKGKHDQLQESFSQLNVELVQLQEKNTQLESLHKQVVVDREELKQTCSKTTEHLDQLKLEHSQLGESLSKMKLEMVQLQEENAHLKEELKNYNMTAQNKEIQLNEQLSQSNAHRIKLQRELSVTQESQSDMLVLMEEKTSRYNVLQKKYKKLQSEYKVRKDKKHEISQTNSSNPSSLLAQPSTKQRLFVTKHDYDSRSSLFGRSGHQELQLRTGDMVTVLGDVNSSGYYVVEFRAQRGLVHHRVLDEVDISMTRRLSDQSSYSTFESSMVSSAAHGDRRSRHMSLSTTQYDFGPLPPSELKIENVMLNKASVSWKVPFISAVGLSNGYKVEGYQLYVDDSLHTRIKGCYECTGVVEGVDFTQPHKLSVAAYSIDGLISETCEVYCTPQERTINIVSSSVPDLYKATHKHYTQVKTGCSPDLQYEQVNTSDQRVNTSTRKLHQQGRHHVGRVHSKPSKH